MRRQHRTHDLEAPGSDPDRSRSLPAHRRDGLTLGRALGVLFCLVGLATSSASLAAEPASPAAQVPVLLMASAAATAPPAAPAIDPLFVVPGRMSFRSDAQRTDESLAAAVELGNNPDLEPVSKFRKRSTDLFRTEREVEIDGREMLLRLRLRAKTRRAVSVELRF